MQLKDAQVYVPREETEVSMLGTNVIHMFT